MHTAKGAMEGDGETATAPSQETEDNWVATQEGRESALASPAPEDRESESDEYENTGEGAWLMGGEPEEEYDDYEEPGPCAKRCITCCGCWAHPRFRRKWPAVVATCLFLILGFGLIVTAIAVEVTPSFEFEESFIFALLGCILILPGGYLFFLLYRAYHGHRGYTFDRIPNFGLAAPL